MSDHDMALLRIDHLEAEVSDLKSANALLHGLVSNRDAEIERLTKRAAELEMILINHKLSGCALEQKK